jgi:chromosome segregation ATPase
MPSRQAKPGAPTADEVPVTRGMLAGVRTEVLQRIDQGREEAKAENQQFEGKIEQVDAKIEKVDAKIERVDAKIDAVRAELQEVGHRFDAAIHAVKAGMARLEVLLEEQNAQTTLILNGIAALLSRPNPVEQRLAQLEDTVRKLAAARPAG